MMRPDPDPNSLTNKLYPQHWFRGIHFFTTSGQGWKASLIKRDILIDPTVSKNSVINWKISFGRLFIEKTILLM